jgi:cytoskeletal protein RodZ
MTSSSTDPQRPAGYRGALPERDDRLARPWILTVIAIFVLIIVLSLLQVPSRFFPEPTASPTPSVAPSESPSADPSAEDSAGASASPEESAAPSDAASEEASADASAEASASP